jgi:3-hydroxy-3-methylglutaryl CoA synthase
MRIGAMAPGPAAVSRSQRHHSGPREIPMVGITSYGAYIPMWRLPLAAITGGGGPRGEKAVANFDEDSITMAVAAAVDCLRGHQRESVDAVLFASTSYPYKEKLGASIVAKALDLRRDVATADLGHSLRAGTMALRSAADAILAGSARRVLVVAADCRMAAPRSALDMRLADGAAAFLLSDADVAAALTDRHVISDEIIDVWRTDRDPYVHTWEERFVVDHGYTANITEAIAGLLQKTGRAPQDVTKAVLYTPDARSLGAAAQATGLDPSRLQRAFFGQIGNTGAAFVPMLLVAALEDAADGERLLVGSYGDGAEAFFLEVREEIVRVKNRRGIGWHLKRRAELTSYEKYLRFRNLFPTEFDRRAGAGLSATIHFRDRDEDLSLHGYKCRRCGMLQFPRQRVCFGCYARDDFETVRLSDRTGQLLSFTMDYFAGSPDPPLVATVTETEGGCRLFIQMTDGSATDAKLGLPVELTFRKIHDAGGTPNYFWKCTPIR